MFISASLLVGEPILVQAVQQFFQPQSESLSLRATTASSFDSNLTNS